MSPGVTRRSRRTILAIAFGPWLAGCGSGPLEVTEAHPPAPPPEKIPPPRAPAAGGEWTNSLGMRFRVIESGEFLLEIPEEAGARPRSAREAFRRRRAGLPDPPPPATRPVRITRPYAVSICEVTGDQYREVTGQNPRGLGEDEEPAYGMTYQAAEEFCRRLSELPQERAAGRTYRLPTLAELFHAGLRSRNTSESGCYAWHRTARHVGVWNFCRDIFDVDYFQRLPTDLPTEDPLASGPGCEHVVHLSWTHPDPHSGNLYTIRVVSVPEPGS